MAEDDIYQNKRRYDNFVKRLENMVIPPAQRKGKGIYKCKYWCKNKANLEYFRKLFDIFEFDDLSYIRRMRVIRVIQLICYLTDKDLKKLERPDMNKMVVYVRNHFAVKTQQGFILDVRYIWRRILPEKDERGRYDETIVPYVVRHLSGKIDRSKQKIRQDKLTPEEFDKLLAYFSDDLRMQAYLSLALESLGRPQTSSACQSCYL